MSHQRYDRGAPSGNPNYDMAASAGRRVLPQNYNPSDRQARPPPLRIPHPRGPPPGNRGPSRPPPQQQYRPESVDSLYDGSAYGGADEFDQWPLPSRPFAPSGQNSPRGSPRESPRGSPRRPGPPPQRPQRPDYQEPILDPPRPTARVAPANRAYHQPSPPQQAYHGTGQWTGDGYRSPPQQPLPPPSRPPPQAAHPPPEHFQPPQALQQAVYAQRTQQRVPLGPPPSARRGPAFNYPPVAPVHPIAEETDSMRGSIRNASTAFDGSHASYASSNAIMIGVPGYYLEDRGSGVSHPSHIMSQAPRNMNRPSMEMYDDLPPEPAYESGRDSGRDYAESPSPEPAALIRQASLGKRTKPTLTTVKSGERMGRDGEQRNVTPPKDTARVVDKEMARPKESFSSSEDEELNRAERSGHEEKALEAAGVGAVGVAAAGTALYAARTQSRDNLGPRTPSSSDILSSGTGLLDPSSDESEKAPKKRSSRELLGAMLGKDRSRSRSRSPLSLIGAAQRESVVAASPREPETPDLSRDAPGPEVPEQSARRRPLKLDIDAVRDAEARGSLTSLSDLIRRATKLASNLDRGRTASRLGMNFFEGLDSTERALAVQEANRRSGSISDILTSFPPPGERDGDSTLRGFTDFSHMRHSHLPSDSDAGAIRTRKKRKCCGMQAWLFVILLLLVFLLIAAAVLVPVVLLIILPNQDTSSHSGQVSSRAVLL